MKVIYSQHYVGVAGACGEGLLVGGCCIEMVQVSLPEGSPSLVWAYWCTALVLEK